jgi:DNA-binding LytR/AlgR family response regulator
MWFSFTAYDKFSLKAFEEKTLDYLLKPVDRKRLARTVMKLQQAIGQYRRPPVYETQEIRRIPCLIGNRIRLIGYLVSCQASSIVSYLSFWPPGFVAQSVT